MLYYHVICVLNQLKIICIPFFSFFFFLQKCEIYGHLEFFLFYFTSLPQKLIIEKYNYMYIEAPLNLSVIKSYYSLMILLYRYPLIPLDDIF